MIQAHLSLTSTLFGRILKLGKMYINHVNLISQIDFEEQKVKRRLRNRFQYSPASRNSKLLGLQQTTRNLVYRP